VSRLAPLDRAAKLTVAAATAAALMIGMDFIGVASVLTAVERDLGTDLTSTQWLMNLYALTFGMALVTALLGLWWLKRGLGDSCGGWFRSTDL